MGIVVWHNRAFVAVELDDQTYLYEKAKKGHVPHSFAPRSQWSTLTLDLPGGRWEGMPRRLAQEWVARAQKFVKTQTVRDSTYLKVKEFVASPDFGTIEKRVLAIASSEPSDAILVGEDIHRKTAAAMSGVPLESVTPDQRYATSVANFTRLYGSSGVKET